MHRRDVIWTVLIVTFVSLCVQGFAARRADLYQEFETLAIVVEKIRDNYVEEVEEKDIFEGALRGALRSLDGYSAYISPEDFEEFRTQTKGEFQGLGIEIGIRQNWLTVIAPIEDTPAWRAGIRAGDRIIKIEGKSTEKMSTLDAVKVLRGKKGTKVTITIVHEGERKPIDLTITRDVIPLISVRGYRRNDEAGHWDYFVDPEHKIGYIRLNAFQENSVQELDKAVADLESKGMKGLVLDLRFNPGGLLSTAVNVADRFLENGVVVSTRGRAVQSVSYKAHKFGTYRDFPLALLVNNWSASASEIVAGAVQDHRRGIIVGEHTFGKGSVQNVIPLRGGKSALKLTTAYYYTPSGRSIHRKEDNGDGGLIPDIVVETDTEEEVKIQRLWQALGTPPSPKKEGEEKPGEEKPISEVPELEDAPEVKEKPTEKPAEFKDEQLTRAVDALKVMVLLRKEPAPAVDTPTPEKEDKPATNL
ncbi:MAG TPA: S41 family peptidase [Planctomycetota bacterium]|nr:S41 family peptidase [Planctomycetota bacterium]